MGSNATSPQVRPVVVGVDGSGSAQGTLDLAVAEAARLAAPLLIVHAWPGRYTGAFRGRNTAAPSADGRHLLEVAAARARLAQPDLAISNAHVESPLGRRRIGALRRERWLRRRTRLRGASLGNGARSVVRTIPRRTGRPRDRVRPGPGAHDRARVPPGQIARCRHRPARTIRRTLVRIGRSRTGRPAIRPVPGGSRAGGLACRRPRVGSCHNGGRAALIATRPPHLRLDAVRSAVRRRPRPPTAGLFPVRRPRVGRRCRPALSPGR
ncbi:universal stress protein [Paractinoplanes tereljensis]|uniref:universal stress protein n=1 Tax=Paractinoplanes tereljensis TaxID=571912 RepID=UPI00194592AB